MCVCVLLGLLFSLSLGQAIQRLCSGCLLPLDTVLTGSISFVLKDKVLSLLTVVFMRPCYCQGFYALHKVNGASSDPTFGQPQTVKQ